MNTPILIVEDEAIVAMEIASFVTQLGFDVVATATNADDAYTLAMKHQPHLILMDINLKGDNDGINAAEKILKSVHTSIIYITAFNDENTIERAVKTNPAAYLIKPFNRHELSAAAKIALVHYHQNEDKQHIKKGDTIFDSEFSYDTQQQQLLCCGEFIHLTRREQQLLHLLVLSKNTIIPIAIIETIIWPETSPAESTRRALVSRLRTKLKHQFLETVSSVGYRLNI
ncbi:MAG: response regulator [Campylobacterota bacterium]|nr:response regulator [Campylobacterota bacterium]